MLRLSGLAFRPPQPLPYLRLILLGFDIECSISDLRAPSFQFS
jgi:hypothetical protein